MPDYRLSVSRAFGLARDYPTCHRYVTGDVIMGLVASRPPPPPPTQCYVGYAYACSLLLKTPRKSGV